MKVLAELERVSFTAASDTSAANLAAAVAAYDVAGFAGAEELLDSGLVDAVLIATPHYFHPTYAVAALERGLHVLTEKPVAVTAAAAQQMNEAAAKRPDLKFAAMFQMRTAEKWRRIKALLDAGELGPLQRVMWIATNWFRTQAYYDSGDWRATWAGEGGGVLLNQCPHNLDLLCWLTGMPTSVWAQVALGKYHDIEVEDEVTALLEYPDGATGVFVASTGESPGTDYLELTGDRGRIITPVPGPDGKACGTAFQLDRLELPASEFCRTSPRGFSRAPAQVETVECEGRGGHEDVHRDFVEAVLDDRPVVAPAVEGIQSVELVNAMVMSGLQGRKIELPMDRQAYEALLAQLVADAKS